MSFAEWVFADEQYTRTRLSPSPAFACGASAQVMVRAQASSA